MKSAIKLCMTCLLGTFPVILSAQPIAWNVVRTGGDTLPHCAIKAFDDSLLTLSYSGKEVTLLVDSIKLLFRHIGSQFTTGAAIGTMTGIAVTAVLGMALIHEGKGWFGPALSNLGRILLIIVGGAAGYTVGGLIGESSSRDEVYDLTGYNHRARIMTLRRIVSMRN